MIYTPRFGLTHSEGDSCWRYIISDGVVFYHYAEGCGLYNFNGDYGVSTYNGSLSYFKKGEEEWGTPLKVGVKSYPVQTRKFKIFPNPLSANEKLIISHEGNSNFKIEILSLDGEVLMEQESKSQNTVALDLSHFPSGVFIVRMSTPDKDFSISKITRL